MWTDVLDSRTLPEVRHVDPTVYGLDFGQLLVHSPDPAC
jgi:hypothetical protein